MFRLKRVKQKKDFDKKMDELKRRGKLPGVKVLEIIDKEKETKVNKDRDEKEREREEVLKVLETEDQGIPAPKDIFDDNAEDKPVDD